MARRVSLLQRSAIPEDDVVEPEESDFDLVEEDVGQIGIDDQEGGKKKVGKIQLDNSSSWSL